MESNVLSRRPNTNDKLRIRKFFRESLNVVNCRVVRVEDYGYSAKTGKKVKVSLQEQWVLATDEATITQGREFMREDVNENRFAISNIRVNQ